MGASPSHRTSLVLLLIGALLVRVGWGLHLPVDESALRLLPDQMEYLQLGRNLLQKHSLEFYDERFDATVRAYRTPGYPMLVAMCGGNVTAIRMVQALIDMGTVLATYLLARRWLSERASIFAAAMVAVNPFLIYFTGLILSETLFIAILAWGMAWVPTKRWGLLGSFLLSASVLVRPSAILLPAILTGKNWRQYVITILFIALLVIGWTSRNHLAVGGWDLTTNSGITLYDGFNPRTTGASDQSFVQQMPELRSMSEIRRSEYLKSLAGRFIDHDPFAAISLGVKKILRTWSPIPLSNEYGSRRMYVLIAAAYSVPFDLLVVWGLWSGSLGRAAKVYLMIPAIYFTVAHALSVGSLRYRIPAEVPMAVVASGVGFRVSGLGKDKSLPTQHPSPETRNPM